MSWDHKLNHTDYAFSETIHFAELQVWRGIAQEGVQCCYCKSRIHNVGSHIFGNEEVLARYYNSE